jgi:radical SAM enzyme (TIGR01210 family)
MATALYRDADILGARPPKQRLDPWKPYAFFVETERAASGRLEEVATIFLTNQECPFHCTMCDLWKNTLDERVPVGAIPAQIEYALERLPAARSVKLYNAGNFFDAQAIPPEDHQAIISLVRQFETVVVENHPRLTDERCVRFRDRLGTRLEIALGLETIHPDILPRLNKQMTVDDFDRCTTLLCQHDIDVRAFILLRPPGLSESDGVAWALHSIAHAFDAGVGCCSVIPTRMGNGFMERLQSTGDFSVPTITSMADVLEQGISLARGRVFVDLWDAHTFCNCRKCGPMQIERLSRMNLSQQFESRVVCDCGS